MMQEEVCTNTVSFVVMPPQLKEQKAAIGWVVLGGAGLAGAALALHTALQA